jgi:hypothetical protein
MPGIGITHVGEITLGPLCACAIASVWHGDGNGFRAAVKSGDDPTKIKDVCSK